MSWCIGEKMENNYLEKCALFVKDDEKFKNFKRDKDYQKILEGNERPVGMIAINGLRRLGKIDWFLGNIEKFKENETVGNPEILDYENVKVAPSTIRYANTCFEIQELMGDFVPKSILEIGGGYGGLCKSLSVMYDFDSYKIVDLPQAVALCEKYLSNFPIHSKVTYQSSDTPIEGEYDLFIADSSLSECDGETQIKYAEVANKCKFVYIVYNTFHIENGRQNFEKMMTYFKGFTFGHRSIQDVAILYLKKNA